MGLKATVTNGRLVVDEPTTLPDGTVLELLIDDEGDELDDEQRAALDAAISESLFGNTLIEPRAGPANDNGEVLRKQRLGGLLSFYERRAA